MILEIVSLSVRVGDEAAFEAAFDKARRLLPGIDGYSSHELRRSIECPQEYVLLMEWRALENVTLGFRKSREFVRWHELLASFVAQAPVIQYVGAEIRASELEVRWPQAID